MTEETFARGHLASKCKKQILSYINLSFLLIVNCNYSIRGFEDTGDAPILKPLIDAYSYGDEDKFQKLINHPHIKSNDNEVKCCNLI